MNAGVSPGRTFLNRREDVCGQGRRKKAGHTNENGLHAEAVPVIGTVGEAVTD
jgi:hypothetical protein